MILGRLDFWTNKVSEWGKETAPCGCHLFDLGYIGIGWLVGDCYLKRNEIDSDERQ